MRENTKNIVKAVSFALIPLAICVIYAALQGVMLWEIDNYAVNLPQYNDGIFYVKHIEAMVNYGMPQGYFGYNESQAAIGTLGSWPIFVFVPYVIIGKIIGFSATHMMWINLFFVTAACFAFYYMAKPNLKQSIILFLFMLCVPIVPRYILSCMVEPLFYAADILFAGFFVYFSRADYGRKSLIAAYILAVFFALCRPYMLIFVLIPAFYHFKISKIESVAAFVMSVGLFATVYLFYVMPRCAAYSEQTLETDMFYIIKDKGIIAFLFRFIYKFLIDLKSLIFECIPSFTEVFVLYISVAVILMALVLFVIGKIKQTKTFNDAGIIAAGCTIFISAAVIFALIALYVEYTSARHIAVLIVFASVISAMYMIDYKKMTVAVIMLLAIISYGNIHKMDNIYVLPTSEDPFSVMPNEIDAKKLKDVFDKEPSENLWENTVVFEYNNQNMNYMYFLPEYVGISISDKQYITENADKLKSKYVLVMNDPKYIEIFENSGYMAKILSDDFMLYEKKA